MSLHNFCKEKHSNISSLQSSKHRDDIHNSVHKFIEAIILNTQRSRWAYPKDGIVLDDKAINIEYSYCYPSMVIEKVYSCSFSTMVYL